MNASCAVGAPLSDSPYTYHDPAHLDEIRDNLHNQAYEDRLPSPEELHKAADLPVIDQKGSVIPFYQLYSSNGEEKSRHLIIFIRHFFCGLCQEFVRALSRDLPPSSLPSDTRISFIGCGQAALIADYRSKTQCPYPIYADPTRRLYTVFNMVETLAMGPKQPDYQSKSTRTMIMHSMSQVLSSGSHAMKGGNFSQVGGEILFRQGNPVWAHRMRHTRDHTEIPKLEEVIGAI